MGDPEYAASIRFRHRLSQGPWRLLGSRHDKGYVWEVYSYADGVCVFRTDKVRSGECSWHYFQRTTEVSDMWLSNGAVVNKYIQAVKAKAKKGSKGSVTGDPFLCQGRPALTAFLTETGADEKDVRELSALMVAHEADGVRVGLKDDDCGGWLWRGGKDLAAALDAIEKALTDGTALFGGAKDRKARRGVR